ncbi:MAG: sulfurtransferase TusA [Pseudomonadota bacterium]|nr:sulfurtransferase TusA [Pseudomonadota bacterium]
MSKEPNDLNENSEMVDAELELDARGLYCPEPVMLLHNKIRDIEAGQILKLVATDPSTIRDVPKFCLYLGHELLAQEQHGQLYQYLVKKKQD